MNNLEAEGASRRTSTTELQKGASGASAARVKISQLG